MCCSVHPLQPGEGDWDMGEDPHRRATFAHSKPREEEEGSPVLLRRETVGADLAADKTDRLKVLPISLSCIVFISGCLLLRERDVDVWSAPSPTLT